MNDWTSGYIAEIDYTHGYYRELNPNLMRMALLNKCIASRTVSKPMRYLELGFGQGLSLAIHAASCPGEYWGTDFNPVHAANAMEMVEAAGVNATILDSSFAELAGRTDMPEFDVIALHGIWSWISDENRRLIVDIVRNRLAVGGILYISYNCTPGWSASIPLRHILTLHAELAGADEMGITKKIEGALDFARQLAACEAGYFKANAAVVERLDTICKQNKNYLAHEYFNRDWLPMPFSEVSNFFASAKLEFAASAALLDHIDPVNLSPEMQEVIKQINQPVLRESVRDYMTNAQFRKDIFVKGSRSISYAQQTDIYKKQRFILLAMPEDVPMKLNSSIGEANLQEDIYKPLLNMLAENNFAPKNFHELFCHASWEGRHINILVQAMAVLTGTGYVHPVQESDAINDAIASSKALNDHLCKKSYYANDINHLSSPVIGGGVQVGRFEQLFLMARKEGNEAPEQLAAFVWQILESQNQRILKDEKPLETGEENLAELTSQAIEFINKRLPVFRALLIAE